MGRGAATSGALVIALAVTGLGLGSVASAQDVRLTGETSDGVAVALRVGYFGNATAFRVAGHDVKCDDGGTLRQRRRVYGKFVFSDPGEFLIRSRRTKQEDGLTIRKKVRIRGEIAADNMTWSGIYRSITRVYENGELMDTCRVRSVWHVS